MICEKHGLTGLSHPGKRDPFPRQAFFLTIPKASAIIP
jgi:hypothetical protein